MLDVGDVGCCQGRKTTLEYAFSNESNENWTIYQSRDSFRNLWFDINRKTSYIHSNVYAHMCWDTKLPEWTVKSGKLLLRFTART